MEVLTTESLEKLRSECKLNPELVLVDFKDIVDKYNLILIPLSDISFDLKDLRLPDGFKQDKNKDLENCKIIGESLNKMNFLARLKRTGLEATERAIKDYETIFNLTREDLPIKFKGLIDNYNYFGGFEVEGDGDLSPDKIF